MAGQQFFVTFNTLLYFWVYRREIRPHVLAKNKGWFWTGFFKDVTIYSLAALFIANGLNRFLHALHYLEPKDMWTVFKLFAGFTAFVAIIAIAMDLLYVGADEKKHGLYREYPTAGPRAIMRFHIYFRFIVLFTIPLLIWFSYLAAQVTNAAQR